MSDAILDDRRTITSLTATHPSGDESYWKVGDRNYGCKSIVAEAVNGLYAPVAWFAIETETGLVRVNGAFVFSLTYANATQRVVSDVETGETMPDKYVTARSHAKFLDTWEVFYQPGTSSRADTPEKMTKRKAEAMWKCCRGYYPTQKGE